MSDSITKFRPLSRPIALLAATGLLVLAGTGNARAATIGIGNVTTALGPAFFVDDAATGGGDSVFTQPAIAVFNRSFAGMLTRNQGMTRFALTGFGLATSSSAATNTATTLAVAITYLGSDEVVGGGDDVVLGSAAGSYVYSGAGEYVFAFDAPMTANLAITGVRFQVQVTPTKSGGGGAVSFKTGTLGYETGSGAKLTVSGIVAPQRLNLAKYQPVTTDSVTGQQLASYVTDGVAGNDNRWQSAGSAPHWARVDFPFPVQAGSAQVFSGVDDSLAMTAFKLQYLSNAIWVDVPGGSVTSNTNVERNIVFTTPVTASSFRLYNSADGTIRIRELALYPPNGAGGYSVGTDLTLNLAHNRPAVATTNTTGNHALLATDGRVNNDSKWQTSAAGVNELEIDLRTSTKIGSAHLYSGSTGVVPLADFVLKSWDGAAWQDIPGSSVTGNASPALVIPFTSTVTTSKVKLVFTNPATSSVQEFCIFPANDGNAGYPIGTGVTGAPPSPAKFDDFSDAFYRITNPAAGRLIAVSNGAPVLDDPGPPPAQGQYQVLLNLGASTYRLRNRATGNCLSGPQLSTAPGTPLTDAPYSALPDQDWIVKSINSTDFYLINQWSGLVIDTQGGGTAPGTPLVQNVNTGASTQRWQLAYAEKFPKKGVGGTSFATAFNINWAYNWGMSNSNSMPSGAVFDPMQWGDYNWNAGTTAPSTWKLYPAWRATGRSLHLMGFNEPDKWDQSGKSLDPTNPPDASAFSATRSMEEAVMLWPRLMAMDQPLVAPCPANMTGGWLSSFYANAANLGYRVDYTSKHSYGSPNGGSSDALFNDLQVGYTTWGRPMWLTEFSFVDWSGTSSWSEEDTYNCLAEFLWRAESTSWLRKYALFVFTEDAGNPQPANPWQNFTPAPRSNSYDIDGNLTAFGELFSGWDCDANVRTDKTYYIHNKNTRKRLANVTTQTNAAGRNIRITGDLVRWTLVASPTSGRYYLVSQLDGRRLSYDGTSVSLVTAGTTGTAVQWGLTENPGKPQYGWYFLDHPSTSKRLKLVYNNSNYTATFSMVADTTTSDDVQWRFIVPLPPAAWTGAGGKSWTTAGNWTSNSIPSPGSSVLFNSFSTSNPGTVLNQDFNLQGVTVTDPVAAVSIGGTNSLTLGAGGLDLSAATRNLTITAPVILGGAQTWNVAGGRTLGIAGTVSGAFDITLTGGGKVSPGASDVLPNGAAAGNVIVNGTLDLNGTAQSINGLSGSGIVDNTGGGDGVLTIGNNDAVSTLAGTLQNSGGTLALVKTGVGNLTLSTANTFSGGTTIDGGAVYPKNDASFGIGTVTLNVGTTLYGTTGIFMFGNELTLHGGTLRVGGGSGKSITWTGPVNVTADSIIQCDGSTVGITLSGSVTNHGFTLSSAPNGTSNTISGPISGTGTITAATYATGTLNLNAANPFGGTYRAALGFLKTGDPNALQNGTLDMNVADSGTVNLNNLSATIGALTGSRNLSLGSGVVSIGNNNADTTYTGVLSGSGSLTKIGNGSLTLSGTNTYGGATNVNGGTLAIGAGNILPNTTAVSIGNATLDAATFTDTAGTLDVTGTATIHLGTGAALAFANSAAVDWSGGSLNLTGTFVSGSSLRFGTNAAGLTPAQLALISSPGSGRFVLNSSGFLAVANYGTWAAINAPNGTPADDFDGDGVSNGVEYILGGSKNTRDAGKLPQVSATGGWITFTFFRDSSSIDGVTQVAIEEGTTLADWPVSHAVPDLAVANDPGVSVVKDSPPGHDTVTLRLPMAPNPVRFLRLQVIP